MSIKITTDSTCDLPQALLEAYGIQVVPLYIIREGIPLRDGVEISPDDIFRHVEQGGALTSTAAVNVEDYRVFFAQFSPHYDAVIHINLGSGFSSCHQNALLAAAEFPNVYPVDSQNLSTGHGLLVLEAARMVAEGMEAESITKALEKLTGLVETSFVLDRLDYLHKGGRCSSVAALGANLLRLKPCIELEENRMRVGKKYRGSFDRAIQEYTRDRLAGRDDLDLRQAFVVHTTACPPEYVEQVCQAVAQYARFSEIQTSTAGCTISSHCGPCTLGVMFLRKVRTA